MSLKWYPFTDGDYGFGESYIELFKKMAFEDYDIDMK